MNVATVLASKNNFELAKWFKQLMDSQGTSLDNYSSVPALPRATLQADTPRRQLEESGEKKRRMESAGKGSQGKAKRLSMAKSEACFFKDKRQQRTELKLPIPREPKQESKVFYETQPIRQQESADPDISEVLYERALE